MGVRQKDSKLSELGSQGSAKVPQSGQDTGQYCKKDTVLIMTLCDIIDTIINQGQDLLKIVKFSDKMKALFEFD